MMKDLPKDPIILLSYVNTKLRDHYPNLKELQKGLGLSDEELIELIDTLGDREYCYDERFNQFM